MSNETIHEFENCFPIRVTMLSEKWGEGLLLGAPKIKLLETDRRSTTPKSGSKLYIKNHILC